MAALDAYKGSATLGLGQRFSKTVNGLTTLFAYDAEGHLVGEYDGEGKNRNGVRHDYFQEQPGQTAAAYLQAVAEQLKHPQPDVIYEGRLKIVQDLAGKHIILLNAQK